MRRTKKTEKGLVQEGGLARRSVHAKAGRIVIPRRLRKVFEIRDGTPVVLEVKPEGILLSRNDSVGVGDRDRPGRFHRRLADELGCICTKLNGDNFGKPGWPAGRRPVRARRTRSPLLTESFRLRPVTSPMIRRVRGILKRKPGQKPLVVEWVRHKRDERRLEKGKAAKSSPPGDPRKKEMQNRGLTPAGRAMLRAALVARKTARAHGTPLYVWRDGQIVVEKP